MIIFKMPINKKLHKILGLFLVLMLLQGCKAYQNSTNLEQASQGEQNGYFKVTMQNGDEFIYESIEFANGNYYGIKTVNGENVKTTILNKDVLKVERRNKNSSGFFGVVGIAIGVASIILAVLMFGG